MAAKHLDKETKKQIEHEVEKRLQSKIAKEAAAFRKEFADKTLKLMTSGFGLVAALAWNEFVKELINVYIQPLFGEDSALVSHFVYAVIVTFLAVFVTYNLSKIAGVEKKE